MNIKDEKTMSWHDAETKERPSWRELDQRKDRSLHRGSQDEKQPSYQERKQQYQVDRYKKQLESFFQGGSKPTAEQEVVLKKIRQQRGKGLNQACIEYYEKFGVPGQWDNMMLLLEATDEKVLAAVIGAMDKIFAEQTASQQTLFKQRLRLASMSVVDLQLRDQLEQLLRRLA